MRLEEPLVAGVEADEGVQEGGRRGRQVHDVVGESPRLGDGVENLPRRSWGVWVRWTSMHFLSDDNFPRRSRQELPCRFLDECPRVLVGSADELPDFVAYDSVVQSFVAVGVQVVGPDEDFVLSSWDGKGPYAGHGVTDDFSLLELGDQPCVLGAQPAVPVHVCVVEAELAVIFLRDDVQVFVAGYDLQGEGSEFVFGAYVVEFVDDGFDSGVLVHDYRGDEILIGEILVSEVEVSCQRSIWGI